MTRALQQDPGDKSQSKWVDRFLHLGCWLRIDQRLERQSNDGFLDEMEEGEDHQFVPVGLKKRVSANVK